MNPTGPLTRADHRGEAEEGAVSAHTAAVAPDTDRDTAVAALFETHHAGLLRLAVLLGAGPDAEDVVAEAFYQLQRRWGRIRDKDAAVGYLRGVILNLTRMRFRHLRVVRRHAQQNVEFAEDSAEQHALLRDEHRHVVSALRTLPTR